MSALFSKTKFEPTVATVTDHDGKTVTVSATVLQKPFITIQVGNETANPDARSLIHMILAVHPGLMDGKGAK